MYITLTPILPAKKSRLLVDFSWLFMACTMSKNSYTDPLGTILKVNNFGHRPTYQVKNTNISKNGSISALRCTGEKKDTSQLLFYLKKEALQASESLRSFSITTSSGNMFHYRPTIDKSRVPQVTWTAVSDIINIIDVHRTDDDRAV